MKQQKLDPEPKVSKRQQKTNRVERLCIQYNVTLETLVDRGGRPITDAKILKAGKLVELKLLEHLEYMDEPMNRYTMEHWLVKPIAGYNKTPYLATCVVYSDYMTAECNCQHVTSQRRKWERGKEPHLSPYFISPCSHILALQMQKELLGMTVTVYPGVRPSPRIRGEFT